VREVKSRATLATEAVEKSPDLVSPPVRQHGNDMLGILSNVIAIASPQELIGQFWSGLRRNKTVGLQLVEKINKGFLFGHLGIISTIPASSNRTDPMAVRPANMSTFDWYFDTPRRLVRGSSNATSVA